MEAVFDHVHKSARVKTETDGGRSHHLLTRPARSSLPYRNLLHRPHVNSPKHLLLVPLHLLEVNSLGSLDTIPSAHPSRRGRKDLERCPQSLDGPVIKKTWSLRQQRRLSRISQDEASRESFIFFLQPGQSLQLSAQQDVLVAELPYGPMLDNDRYGRNRSNERDGATRL